MIQKWSLQRIVLMIACVLSLLFISAVPASAAETMQFEEVASEGVIVGVSRTGSGIKYITPEQFGAKGDGVTDDSAAFEKCMKDPTTYVLLTGKYLITRYLSTNIKKYFYAYPKSGYAGASIICNPRNDVKTLSFYNVTFENVQFYSTLLRSGTSPHGEKYKRTSNTVFVEVWYGSGNFENCYFINAVVAIRGRKSTGLTAIPQNLKINKCTFTECKIPIQGYSENTTVSNSTFINDGELYRKRDNAGYNVSRYNGDVYSGDHCVYMEAFGCRSVSISGCVVRTLNSESGASFQIYGNQAAGDVVPSMMIDSCEMHSNGVASAKNANVVIKNTVFNEQKAANYIMWVESGSAVLLNSEFNHTYAFSYASTSVKPQATGCTFRLLTDMSQIRCNFPYSSDNCTYINWGGNVKLNGTSFTGCIFTSETSRTLNNLYISNKSGKTIFLRNTSFKKGSVITNSTSAVAETTGCSTFN